jgi:putative endonuclease
MAESVKRTQKGKRRVRQRIACCVYVLGSTGKGGYRTYVGWTVDLDQRLARHNAGAGARSTRGRVWVVLHVERFKTRRKAMSREWFLKRDRKFRKALVEQALLTLA